MTTRVKGQKAQPAKSKKTPRQARSKQMRRDLLDGATRVLKQRGAQALTTNLVAETTGVSVGSLYQYYPDKGALLADLHAEDTTELWRALLLVLRNTELSARKRLETVIQTAFLAQAQASEHHAALKSAGVDVTQSQDLLNLWTDLVAELSLFLRSAIGLTDVEASAQADFCAMTLWGLLAQLGERKMEEAAVVQLASNTARMLCLHLNLP